ncbi:hypothetical protein PIROE2DRAFT_40691 [Piromyces sp. E2]|nr:hypothetical protein PIROE2DRAFT_40691 [Piromyces sp. E2]|eukprot:OUM66576.1 hypothetical protein PIROE2DRAFT_40691 [Piromyces sp. E2]
MNLLNEYNHRFSNFQLAHEIVLNPNFQFYYLNEEDTDGSDEKSASDSNANVISSDNNYNNIISKVTKIAQKAFFDMVQESFDSGNDIQFIPGIVKDIKDRLLYLTNKNKQMYNQINEVLDEKLIIQQIQHGATNFDNIFKYVLDTMLQLCAPVRDPTIKKIYGMENPVQKIKAILNQLDNMKIDLANYNIKKFRPILKEFAVEFERQKFKEAVDSNLIDLEYTEKWLSQSIIRLIKNQSDIKLTKELKKKKKENQTRYIDIYNDAFLSLLFKLIKEDEIVLPETLMFDFGRILEYQQDIRNITIVSSITILCQSIIPYLQGKQFIITKLYKELLDYIEENLPKQRYKQTQKKEERGGNTMTTTTTTNNNNNNNAKPKILSANEKVLLKKMIVNTLVLNNNMYNIISRQIMSLLLHYLKTGDFKEETLDRFGLQYSKDKLQATFSKIKLFTEYNRDVYSEYYDKIIAKLFIINKFYPS